MSVLRGLLFDNLGLKLVALLLAVVVYLNVYTDRPATMMVTFPIHLTDLADSLSLSGPAPAAVQAELRGTAKQLIRLRVAEPPVKISLAGVGVGRFERALGVEDLPLPEGVQVQLDRLVSPRTLELLVDRKETRDLPVAVEIENEPAALRGGRIELRPPRVTVRGPAAALATLDTVHLQPISLAGKRDTLTVEASAQSLPDWCTMEPEHVEVWIPLEPGVTRRFTLELEAPRGESGYDASPARVTAVVTAPRRLVQEAFTDLRASWRLAAPLPQGASRRVAVRSAKALPEGVQVHYEPDSVTVRRTGS